MREPMARGIRYLVRCLDLWRVGLVLAVMALPGRYLEVLLSGICPRTC
jgi:hypothetical protein